MSSDSLCLSNLESRFPSVVSRFKQQALNCVAEFIPTASSAGDAVQHCVRRSWALQEGNQNPSRGA